MQPVIEPDHPLLVRGRRHARDVIEDAARVVRHTHSTEQADACATLSTALQLTITAALTDGFDPQEAYTAVSGLVAWSLLRLPAENRTGVLSALVKSVVDQIAEWPAQADTTSVN